MRSHPGEVLQTYTHTWTICALLSTCVQQFLTQWPHTLHKSQHPTSPSFSYLLLLLTLWISRASSLVMQPLGKDLKLHLNPGPPFYTSQAITHMTTNLGVVLLGELHDYPQILQNLLRCHPVFQNVCIFHSLSNTKVRPYLFSHWRFARWDFLNSCQLCYWNLIMSAFKEPKQQSDLGFEKRATLMNSVLNPGSCVMLLSVQKCFNIRVPLRTPLRSYESLIIQRTLDEFSYQGPMSQRDWGLFFNVWAYNLNSRQEWETCKNLQ